MRSVPSKIAADAARFALRLRHRVSHFVSELSICIIIFPMEVAILGTT